MLFPERVKALAIDLYSLGMRRPILYTATRDYETLNDLLCFFTGVTITLHDDVDVVLFNDWVSREEWGNPPIFYVRVMYQKISVPFKLHRSIRYKLCQWKAPEDCRLSVNETLFQLNPLWRLYA